VQYILGHSLKIADRVLPHVRLAIIFLTCFEFSTHVPQKSHKDKDPKTLNVVPHITHIHCWLGVQCQMKARSSLPAPHVGYIYLIASAFLLVGGTHAIVFSALFPGHAASSTGITAINTLERDGHYKYLVLFSVPVCAYFVIANWVGWQFFRNS